MVSTLRKSLLVLSLSAILFSCGKNDRTAPEVTILGPSSMNLLIGGTYTEQGATATDDKDGDMTSRIELSGTVNTQQSGTYVITYTARDFSGNEGKAERVVYVKNTMAAYEGTYAVHDSVWGGPVTDYMETISASTLTNDRIIFTRFANLANAAVYADYYTTGSQFNVPIQNIYCGTPSLLRSIATPNPGSLLSTSPLSFTMDYQVVEGMNTVNGTATYVKQ